MRGVQILTLLLVGPRNPGLIYAPVDRFHDQMPHTHTGNAFRASRCPPGSRQHIGGERIHKEQVLLTCALTS